MSEADLSKVDSFAIGVILVNMLTAGSYLFESCLSPEYSELIVAGLQDERSTHALRSELSKRITGMHEAELDDLATLL